MSARTRSPRLTLPRLTLMVPVARTPPSSKTMSSTATPAAEASTVPSRANSWASHPGSAGPSPAATAARTTAARSSPSARSLPDAVPSAADRAPLNTALAEAEVRDRFTGMAASSASRPRLSANPSFTPRATSSPSARNGPVRDSAVISALSRSTLSTVPAAVSR